MISDTMSRIRDAAETSGWQIYAVAGSRLSDGFRWDRDIFRIGKVDRHLSDGTPVTECEHSIEVWYQRNGAVHSATGHQFTVLKVLYHQGISSGRHSGSNKAERIIAALEAQTSVIPGQVT